MKKIYLLSFVLLSIALHAQKVIELPMTSSKVVVKLVFRNGSISDPTGKEGLTNLTASLLTDTGSDQYTKSQIDDLLYPMAASYYASTDKEVCTITFEVHKDMLDRFYEIFRGLLLHPSFAESDFERLKSNTEVFIKEVIKTNSDEDFSKMALEDILFHGTPYQHMKPGTLEGLQSITREDVVNHYKNFFTRNNVTIGIAGAYTPAFLEKLKKDVQQLPDTKPVLPVISAPRMPNGIEVELVPKKENLGTAIFAGYPLAINRSSADWPAMMVVNSYLGEHRKSYSKLFQLIREQRSMNYGDYTYIEWYPQGGGRMLPGTGVPRSQNYFSIWIRPVQTAYSLKSQYPELSKIQIGHAHFALRMALYEIERVKNEGLTQEEFELTRQFLRSYMKLYIQTPESQLGFKLDADYYGMEDYIGTMDTKLAALTLADVNAVAKKYLQTQNMYVTMITDEAEAPKLKESLLQNKPSPMAYSNVVRSSLPQSVLDLDKKVEVFPLNVKKVTIVPPAELFIKSE